MKRRAAIGVVILIAAGALSAAGVAAFRREREGRPPSGPPTAVVTRGTFVDSLQLRGEIRPVRSVILSAPSSGTDLQIVDLVKNGARVSAGDVIAEFDPTVQQRTLETKRSELNQAESEVARTGAELTRRVQAAQSELEEARKAVQRAALDVQANELRPRIEAEKLVIILSDAETHVRELEQKVEGERIAAAADVAIARQKREKASYDVREAERIIGSLAIRAPTGGSVSLLPNFRAGGPFSRAAPEFKRGDRAWFGAAIAELPDLTAVKMTARVDEFDRGRVQQGSPVRVRVDAVPDRELTGTLTDISVVAKPDFSSWPPARNFDLVIAIADGDERLRSGMSASARVELDRLPGVLLLPSGAIFPRGGGTVAYVVSGGTTESRPVMVLRRGREQVALASGLREGERVSLREPDAAETAR
jgi:multidrug efflux pump subunit AcrA (membrane-fusion protein)